MSVIETKPPEVAPPLSAAELPRAEPVGMQLWQYRPGKCGKAMPVGGSAAHPDSHDELLNISSGRELDFNQPVLFCLGGVLLLHDKQKAMAGFGHMAESLLGGEGIYKHGVQVVVGSYNEMPKLDQVMAVIKSRKHSLRKLEWRDRTFSPLAEQYADSFVRKVFGSEEVIPDLNKASPGMRDVELAECARKLRHVNFMGYSMGSHITPYIHDRMAQVMETRGFSEPEIEQTLRNVHVVNFGDTGLWYNQAKRTWKDKNQGHQPWYFTSLHFASTDDRQVSSLSGIKPDLLAEYGRRDLLMHVGDKGNVLVFLSQLPPESEYEKVDRSTIGQRGDGKAQLSSLVTSATIKRERLRKTHAKGVVGGIKKQARRLGLELSIRAGEYSLGKGHDARLYAENLDRADTYISETTGGWMFMPSALKSALRNAVLYSHEHANGNAAELLRATKLTEGEYLPTILTEDGKFIPDRVVEPPPGMSRETPDVYWPAKKGYGYEERIQALRQESIQLAELPPRAAYAWPTAIEEQLAMQGRPVEVHSSDRHTPLEERLRHHHVTIRRIPGGDTNTEERPR